jgi:hypothetical protein
MVDADRPAGKVADPGPVGGQADQGPGAREDMGTAGVSTRPDPINAWAEAVITLSNDCLAGFITWEEYQSILVEEAKKQGFKYDPNAATPPRPQHNGFKY